MRRLFPTHAFVALLLPGAADAHTGEGVQGGLISGFTPVRAAGLVTAVVGAAFLTGEA